MNETRVSGDPELDAFVKVNLVSFSAWDLMVFLHKHPDSESTLSGLCTALARSEKDIAPAVRRCLETGVLEQSDDGDGTTRYRLASDGQIRRTLRRFCELTRVREVRLEFVRTVLSSLAN
jgi:hypothetical protein